MASPTFLIGACEDGSFQGWNLMDDTVANLKAHNDGVVTLKRHESLMISGDMRGVVQVREINNSYNLIQQQIQNSTNAEIQSLLVINFKGIPVIFAGDVTGYITAIVFNNGKFSAASFGAHNENKTGAPGVCCMYMKDQQTMSSVGDDGSIRNWTLA